MDSYLSLNSSSVQFYTLAPHEYATPYNRHNILLCPKSMTSLQITYSINSQT